jgi:hypothetical protein
MPLGTDDSERRTFNSRNRATLSRQMTVILFIELAQPASRYNANSMPPASLRPPVRVVHRTVPKGFTTLAVKGAHFRSFRAPSSRVQPLTFDPVRAAPDRFTRILFQTLPFVLSDDSDC